MTAQTAIHARISGRVQGVGFRVWTQEQALALGLAGWVRNERDGSVSALLAGPNEAVAAMLERLRVGPLGAKVTAVTTTPADDSRTTGVFRILS
ncbi:acylphosphatase [Mesorhizobium sp. LHD-90]|uniref:acylphosphatase n=1 Tax=Mesorhizobium sp. LHD-90 TaxID=3071414 RepID=UPI0027DF81A2|nr:acylphosphatase [Mesorhizobium sp. LHD-90]MDQ6433125.1 acylphosphatase [Mesorhizobium sp. LHD-90]